MGNIREITLEYARKNYRLYPEFYLKEHDGKIHIASYCVNEDGYIQMIRMVFDNKPGSWMVGVDGFGSFLIGFLEECANCIENMKPVPPGTLTDKHQIEIWNEKIIDWNERCE